MSGSEVVKNSLSVSMRGSGFAKNDDNLVFVDDSEGGTRRLFYHPVVDPQSVKTFGRGTVASDALVGFPPATIQVPA